MTYEAIRVAREKAFSDELRAIFDAEVIAAIIREGKVENAENWLRAAMEGHNLKVTAALVPGVHALCEEVQEALRFAEPVEFYIRSASDLNCSAVPRAEDDQPHLVIINSGLLERFTEPELRFVLGHELGHLISRNSELRRIINFVFPVDEGVPLVIRDKIEVWGKLSEMSADRFGYIASPDLDVCLAVFFKLASGVDTQTIRFDPRAYMTEMDRVLEVFRTEMSPVGVSHPINPIRLKALERFAASKLYKDVAAGGDAESDSELSGHLDALVDVLLSKGHSPLAGHRRRFLAAAGLVVAGADGGVSPDELEQILEPLAGFTHFPAEFFREMLEHKDVSGVLTESAAAILQLNPGERFPMFAYMIGVALADRSIDQREVDLLFDVGTKVFQLTRKEVAQMLAEALQRHFVPRLLL